LTPRFPKTVRLDYEDPSLLSFDATVLGIEGSHVILDRTAFYPTSGGQPFDTGRLAGRPVVDVSVDDDGVVRHALVDGPAIEVGARVDGTIDGNRRVDHLEQHHGQHLLSAAFERVASAETVGFHLGETTSTIDLVPEPNADQMRDAETLANRVVREDRAVSWGEFEPAEIEALALRKVPLVEGPIRVVEITDFDRCACGGTHPPRTGAVGSIRITGSERRRGGLRVAFVCGARADAHHRASIDLLRTTSDLLTCGADELPDRVGKLREQNAQLRRTTADQATTLREHEARDRRESAEVLGDVRAVLSVEPERSPDDLAELARAVVSEGAFVAAFAFGGERPGLIVACGPDAGRDARELLAAGLEPMGGRGGGTPRFARGGGKNGDALGQAIAAVTTAITGA
jgi:alanyl-tRNA synthetase